MADRGKTVAVVAYITLIGWVVALVLHQDQNNKSELGAFHLRQMLGLMLTSLAASFLNVIPIIGNLAALIVYIGVIIGWILGIVGAVNERRDAIPFVGPIYQEIFKGLH